MDSPCAPLERTGAVFIDALCKYSGFVPLNITPPGERRRLSTDLMQRSAGSSLAAVSSDRDGHVCPTIHQTLETSQVSQVIFHHLPAVSDCENTFSTQFYKKIRLKNIYICVASVQEMFLFQLQFECLTFSKLADKISWQNRSPCVALPILDYCCGARVSAHVSVSFGFLFERELSHWWEGEGLKNSPLRYDWAISPSTELHPRPSTMSRTQSMPPNLPSVTSKTPPETLIYHLPPRLLLQSPCWDSTDTQATNPGFKFSSRSPTNSRSSLRLRTPEPVIFQHGSPLELFPNGGLPCAYSRLFLNPRSFTRASSSSSVCPFSLVPM